MIGTRGMWLAVCAGFAFRLIIGLVVEAQAHNRGTLCLFDDTAIYWQLGHELAAGRPFVVHQYGVPHHALRTPGYPAFLAVMQKACGERTLPARVVQAGLGALGIPLIAILGASLMRNEPEARRRRVSGAAAWLYALEPYTAATTAFLLSEALSVPLLMVLVLGLVRLIMPAAAGATRPGAPTDWLIPSIGTGLTAGVLMLVRPSIAPYLLLGWLIVWVSGLGGRRAGSARVAVLTCAMLAVLVPWWVRNERVMHAFVPTAVWLGASLYDGWNPAATGASDMRFLDEPAIAAMGEQEQDRYLTRMAWSYARAHPERVLQLAVVKAGRYWSPWPRAEALQTAMPIVAGCVIALPVYGMIIVGAWLRRRDLGMVLVVLGPVLTMALLHMVFVGSLRYRVAVIPPAFVLAAVGAEAVWERVRGRKRGEEGWTGGGMSAQIAQDS